jgi:hypothetical protein
VHGIEHAMIPVIQIAVQIASSLSNARPWRTLSPRMSLSGKTRKQV